MRTMGLSIDLVDSGMYVFRDGFASAIGIALT
jgi:hypothetical protein